jgi:hypothetical protein
MAGGEFAGRGEGFRARGVEIGQIAAVRIFAQTVAVAYAEEETGHGQSHAGGPIQVAA